MTRHWLDRIALVVVALGAAVVAVRSARPWVGSWNDGSRLATVESLVDRHTLAIDESMFVGSPPRDGDERGAIGRAVRIVTKDKLYIEGHYYSDKPPVQALLMAGLFQMWRWMGGAPARQQPEQFCYGMTLASSGLAYVVAVVCVFLIGAAVSLPIVPRLALTASFALSTIALVYARHVNAHIMLLGVAAFLFLQLVRLAGDRLAPLHRLVLIGTAAGLAYTLDLAAGLLLLVAALTLVAYRCRSLRALMVCGLAAVPWLILHHAVNYAIGGTFVPANSVAEYLRWPGSPFGPDNMTGVLNHDGGLDFATYAVALLLGPRGFLEHNLAVVLALVGCVALWRQRPYEAPELLCATGWCAATWLAYAAASNNYAGECVSIRWFVPLLAPAYLLLAVLVRDHRRFLPYLVLLSGWGALIMVRMWWVGPWTHHKGPYFWPLQAAALVSCLAWYWYARRMPRAASTGGDSRPLQVATHG